MELFDSRSTRNLSKDSKTLEAETLLQTLLEKVHLSDEGIVLTYKLTNSLNSNFKGAGEAALFLSLLFSPNPT